MLLHLVVLTALTGIAGNGPAAARPAAPRYVIPRLAHDRSPGVRVSPGIRVWTSRSDVYRRGERVRVYYRTERDAYVTIFRIDTDGRLQVLFPRTPGEDNLGYAGATYTVSVFDRGDAFYVDDAPGVGYVFGVASNDPFNYDAIVSGGRWDVRYAGDGRIHGDPRATLEDLSAQLMAQGYAEYDTHLVPYYVEQHYDYPRFVCYDCHAYTPYAAWDPYSSWCPRYTLVLWNDPFYFYPSYWYPTRYYRGTSVVYRTPGGRTPRYVFTARDNTGSGFGSGIAYRDRRTDAGRDFGRGVRATDIGGVGTVPAPRTPNRRTTTIGGTGGAPDQPGGGTGGTGDQPRGDNGGRGKRDNGRGNGGEPGNGGQLGNGGNRRGNGGEPGNGGQRGNGNMGTVGDGGRRRLDAAPGIEIVPRPAQSGGDNNAPERRKPSDDNGARGYIAPSPRELPVLRPAEEARPNRPEARPSPPPRAVAYPQAAPRQAPPSVRQAPPREASPRQQQQPARGGGGGGGGRRRP